MKFIIGGIIAAAVFGLALLLLGPFAAFIAVILVALIVFIPGLGLFLAAPIVLIWLWMNDFTDLIVPVILGGLALLFVVAVAGNKAAGKPWHHGMIGDTETSKEKE